MQVQIANQHIDINGLDQDKIKAIQFSDFENGSLVDFKENTKSTMFKVINSQVDIGVDELKTLLIMPHYFSEVILMDNQLSVVGSFSRNVYNQTRQYSPNIIAFNLNPNSQVNYVFITNKVPKKIQFLIEDRNSVKNYDQKLLITFTTIYSVIFTLIFVNLVFFVFLKKVSYLYYSLFITWMLFALFFEEGLIAYFPSLSKQIFGIYTQIFWIKLPAIFFWLFVISFLDLKNKSKFDYSMVKIILFIEVAINLLIILLSIFDVSGIYSYLASIVNFLIFITVIVALYIPIKYAILRTPQAIYMAIGITVYMFSVILRIYYTVNLDPMSFWLPRAFEFGLMLKAIILSFGLADQTLRIMKQRDVAEHKFLRVDRELFCKELENSFYQRSTEAIEKYFGTKAQMNRIIDSNFIASLQQLLVVKDVFYVYEYNKKIGIKHISAPVVGFNIVDYIDNNREFLNKVCKENQACCQLYEVSNNSKLPFIIIPIKKKSHDNLCLFLTLPSYVDVDDNLIQDLYIFANTMTHSLLSVRKFQKSIEESRMDALTQVLNRRAVTLKLENLIALACSDNLSITMAFIDFDDFKFINDKYGHGIGDDCLIYLCEKLKDIFVRNAYVGRYGGDEFIVLFKNCSQREIEEKINKLYEYFKNNDCHGIQVKVSIGVAVATKENNLLNSKKLLKAADSALYYSKQNGKNQYTIFSKQVVS